VPRQIRDQVAAALLTLGNSAQGRELLAAVPIEQIGPASAEDYRPLLALDLETFYVEE
jgi:hypothetical protein